MKMNIFTIGLCASLLSQALGNSDKEDEKLVLPKSRITGLKPIMPQPPQVENLYNQDIDANSETSANVQPLPIPELVGGTSDLSEEIELDTVDSRFRKRVFSISPAHAHLVTQGGRISPSDLEECLPASHK